MCYSVECGCNDSLILSKESTTDLMKQTTDQDLLARVTTSQKKALDVFYTFLNKAPTNNKIRTIMESSQPVHAMAVIAVVFVGSVLFPAQSQAPKPYSSFISLIYLLAFCLHLGAQFWMTFVSGLTLYFSLPRHAFGDVQRILFPRYFTINSILSAVILLSFSKLHSHLSWEPRHWTQVTAISCCFLLESLSRLYVAPQVVSLIDKKRIMEANVPGVGMEIGSHCPGRLVKCPHYMALHSSFRKKHCLMAMANVLSMVCTMVHLVCLHQVFASTL